MKKVLVLTTIYFILTSNLFSDDKKISILYKINNNIITNFDVQKEANYLKILNKDLETIKKVQILQLAEKSLIRETVKRNEIEKFYSVDYESNSVDKFISEIVDNLGFESQMDFQNYLVKLNLDINQIRKKIVIEKAWNQLIFDRYNKKIKIDKKEIEKSLEEILKSKSLQKSYRLSEIIFSGKNKEEFEKKYNEILSSIKDIGFSKTAIILSISDTGKSGGEIGWINKNQLSPKIYDEIKNLKIGEFTKPIITKSGNLILFVNEIKDVSNKELDKDNEISKIIAAEKNRQLNEFSIMHYRQIENRSYVKKL